MTEQQLINIIMLLVERMGGHVVLPMEKISVYHPNRLVVAEQDEKRDEIKLSVRSTEVLIGKLDGDDVEVVM